MKIRISCTKSEMAKALDCLETGFELLEISEFCPNRENSKLGRVYVDATPSKTEIDYELLKQVIKNCRKAPRFSHGDIRQNNLV